MFFTNKMGVLIYLLFYYFNECAKIYITFIKYYINYALLHFLNNKTNVKKSNMSTKWEYFINIFPGTVPSLTVSKRKVFNYQITGLTRRHCQYFYSSWQSIVGICANNNEVMVFKGNFKLAC